MRWRRVVSRVWQAWVRWFQGNPRRPDDVSAEAPAGAVVGQTPASDGPPGPDVPDCQLTQPVADLTAGAEHDGAGNEVAQREPLAVPVSTDKVAVPPIAGVAARGESGFALLATFVRGALAALAVVGIVVVVTYGSRIVAQGQLFDDDDEPSGGIQSVFSVLQGGLQRELGSTGLDLATLSFSSLVAGIGLFAVSGWASSLRGQDSLESDDSIQPYEASRQFRTEELTQFLYLGGVTFNLLIIVVANAALPSAVATTVVAATAAIALASIASTTVRRQAAQNHRAALFHEYVNRVVLVAQNVRPQATADQLVLDAARRSGRRSNLVAFVRHHPWRSTMLTALAFTVPMYVLTVRTGTQTRAAEWFSGGLGFVLEFVELFVGAMWVVAVSRELAGNRPAHRTDTWSGWAARVGVWGVISLTLAVLIIGTALDDYPWQYVLGYVVGALCAVATHTLLRNAADVRDMEYDNLTHAVSTAARKYGQELPSPTTTMP